MAASSARNARAISRTLNPPTVFRLSATLASRAIPGWQHMKIMRNSSSRSCSSVSGSFGMTTADRASSLTIASVFSPKPDCGAPSIAALWATRKPCPAFSGTPW
jgi:hypothetical protein